MKKLPVGELKTRFSDVLAEVKSGAEVVITYGKKKENIAVIIPYSAYMKKNSIRVGLLQEKKMKIHDDFELSEEDFVNL